ncbi:unnamed protein product [Eruca vesicaria subsp. sativa]|uniref:Uncharacterized protein n=1 Tax=Eruca vesicaria subsp. sativa TaxID=29727 RepID=A0ABC8LHR1_ERUVS|nr:unnamed protein product [Eruca vesicaria subsp. sativa]
MICGYFRPKFYKKCKHLIKIIKIQLNLQRKRQNAMLNVSKTDILEILNTAHEDDETAYKKVKELLEDRRIISSYDLIEQFCDCISSNLSLMLNQRYFHYILKIVSTLQRSQIFCLYTVSRECPKECREAVYSLMYAAAWVRNVPAELKDLRDLFTRRYGESIDAFVNPELVEKLVRRKSSREVRVQTLQDIAHEANISWDPMSLLLRLHKQTSALHDEKKEKSVAQENTKFRGPQGSASLTSTRNNEVSSTENYKRKSSFKRSKIPDYEEMVAHLRRR